MRGPLRTDGEGAVFRYFAEPVPRDAPRAPRELHTKAAVVAWMVAMLSAIAIAPLLLAAWHIGPLMLLIAVPVLAGAIPFVLKRALRRRDEAALLREGSLDLGRVVKAWEFSQTGSDGGGGQKLVVAYEDGPGSWLKGLVRVEGWPVVLETAPRSLCYVVRCPRRDLVAVMVPGHGLVQIRPEPIDPLDDDLEGDQELEAPIASAAWQPPPKLRATVPLTLVALVMIGLSVKLRDGAFSAAAAIAVVLWIGVMVLTVRRKQQRRAAKTLVGSDGLLQGERFVPWERVSTVQRGGVRLDDGTAISFRGEAEYVEQLRGCAMERWAAYRAVTAPKVPRALQPNREDLGPWAGGLGELVAAGAGASMRSAGLTRETLWELARHVGVPGPSRGAAVLALGAVRRSRDAERWAELAADTAEPYLRQVFELAAQQAEESELVAALEALATAGLPTVRP